MIHEQIHVYEKVITLAGLSYWIEGYEGPRIGITASATLDLIA